VHSESLWILPLWGMLKWNANAFVNGKPRPSRIRDVLRDY
jgi:hypothetical protein